MNLKCHCGNVEISIKEKPKSLTSCNCSICNRYASLWAYYNKEEVFIKVGEEGISSYTCGDKSLTFKHCNICRCITHYKTNDENKTVVNFRMADIKEIDSIRIRRFDGADTWKYLD
ncbi:MAG: aldehyde-activating protein [Candidatus Cloacimonadota bacterium]|nr:MAG: aldehyde-activating protein [Candidatus Cloacimonadota bacterium]